MPLKANLDGNHILSFALPNGLTWDGVRDASHAGRVTMSCCGVPAIPKTMHGHGTRFFAHKVRGDCDWSGESEEHERLKVAAALAAMAAGWSAETEVSGPNWRADVLAEKGGKRIVIEIQWSPQTLPQTLKRTDRYLDAGVEVIWLFRKIPAGLELGASMAAFEIRDEQQVTDLVTRFLTGDLVWNKAILQAVPATLVGYDVMCKTCGIIWHTAPYYIRHGFKFDAQNGHGTLWQIGEQKYFVGKLDALLAKKNPEFLLNKHADPLKRRHGVAFRYCPKCRTIAPEQRLDFKSAMSWPYNQVDFYDRVPRGAGWGFPRRMPKPFSPASTKNMWDGVLNSLGLSISIDDIKIFSPAIREAWRIKKEQEIRQGACPDMKAHLRAMVDEANRQIRAAKEALDREVDKHVETNAIIPVIDDILHVHGPIRVTQQATQDIGAQFSLQFPFNRAIVEQLKERFRGRWAPEIRAWIVKCDLQKSGELLAFLEHVRDYPEAYSEEHWAA
jgi:hypothetical protein